MAEIVIGSFSFEVIRASSGSPTWTAHRRRHLVAGAPEGERHGEADAGAGSRDED